MKYDILNDVKEKMEQELNPNTANKYFASIKKLFEPIQFSDPAEIPKEYIEKQIAVMFKGKNDFSAAKNGLKFFHECCPKLPLPDEQFFKSCSMKKRNRSKKQKKTLSLKETRKKIAGIGDEKLRLSYELAMASGLRVSELAAIKKEDLEFTSIGGLNVTVTAGKGGANGTVECLKDQKLISDLHKYVEHMDPDQTLFFSKEYMMEVAGKSGFECHDLRRIFAQRKRRKLMQEGMSAYEANGEVQKSLRHARFSTTKRYLFNRKLNFDVDEDGNE